MTSAISWVIDLPVNLAEYGSTAMEDAAIWLRMTCHAIQKILSWQLAGFLFVAWVSISIIQLLRRIHKGIERSAELFKKADPRRCLNINTDIYHHPPYFKTVTPSTKEAEDCLAIWFNRARPYFKTDTTSAFRRAMQELSQERFRELELTYDAYAVVIHILVAINNYAMLHGFIPESYNLDMSRVIGGFGGKHGYIPLLKTTLWGKHIKIGYRLGFDPGTDDGLKGYVDLMFGRPITAIAFARWIDKYNPYTEPTAPTFGQWFAPYDHILDVEPSELPFMPHTTDIEPPSSGGRSPRLRRSARLADK